jgi:tetratricopeptide (TPR) repeat protein
MSQARKSGRRWFGLLFAAVALTLATGAARGETPKVKKYPFANPPLEVHDRLGKADVGPVEPFSADDRKLLAEFWDKRTAAPAKDIPQADDAAVTAHLLASGVSDPKARAAYLKKFNELVDAARKATAGAKTDAEKADQLLRFLHKNVMAKGYEEDQTTLHGIFDTGKYNCVSSASLYFLVGTRLGLTLRPVLIPGTSYSAGHAAADLIDGDKRIQVEPTNPEGYDWPAKLKKPGVRVIGPQPDRKKGYDSDGFGLAASAASNLGITAAKADPPRPVESIRWQVIALVFDPTDDTAENNMLAAVINWGLKFDKQDKFADALKVYEFGRAALGSHKQLDHNYHVVWTHRLDEVFGAGQVKDGLKLLPQAAAAFPKDKKFADAAEWVSRAASRKAKKDGWAAGLMFADAALKELTGKAAASVRGWKDYARRQWSQDLLDKGDTDGSLKVIADGLAETPDSKELLAGLSYHTHKALEYLDSEKGTAAAVAHFKELCEKFPKVKEVRANGYDHALDVVNKLTGDKKFAEALKAAATYEPLAGDRLGDLKSEVYDDWGRSLAKDGKWEAAVEKYAEGLKDHPKSKRLHTNAIATVDQWAHKAIDKKDWDEAIKRYDAGLKVVPDSTHLKNKRAYCEKQKEKG